MREKLFEYNIGDDGREKILKDFQKVQGTLNGKKT